MLSKFSRKCWLTQDYETGGQRSDDDDDEHGKTTPVDPVRRAVTDTVDQLVDLNLLVNLRLFHDVLLRVQPANYADASREDTESHPVAKRISCNLRVIACL